MIKLPYETWLSSMNIGYVNSLFFKKVRRWNRRNSIFEWFLNDLCLYLLFLILWDQRISSLKLKYDNWLSLQNELIFLAFVIKRQFQIVEAYLYSDVVEEINFFALICTEFWSKIIFSMVNSWYYILCFTQHYFFFSFSSTVCQSCCIIYFSGPPG